MTGRWQMAMALVAAGMSLTCNPFAPAWDENLDTGSSVLGDPRSVDGVFQNLKYAYTFRDTTIYGQLLSGSFTFLFRDYDRGIDVSWGRDEEMRVTHALFTNVQRLDLVWNLGTVATDSTNMQASVTRNFNLTVTFNPGDIVRVDGYVSLTLTRGNPEHAWSILRWRDESNF